MAGKYLTLDQIAEELGVSAETTRRWVAEGRLRAFRPGRSYLVRPEDFEAFIRSREVHPKAGEAGPEFPAPPREGEAETEAGAQAPTLLERTLREFFIEMRKGAKRVRRDYERQERGPVFAFVRDIEEAGLLDANRWKVDPNTQLRIEALRAELSKLALETGPGYLEDVEAEAEEAKSEARAEARPEESAGERGSKGR